MNDRLNYNSQCGLVAAASSNLGPIPFKSSLNPYLTNSNEFSKRLWKFNELCAISNEGTTHYQQLYELRGG